uniref:Medusin-N1 n=1 Tax=Pithecopus nordestinus TaxID=2034992 RepID=MDS1_PITNO|nr:RecName: Full=Medusin-N1; Short=MDS-N1; AltName: Full=Phylloseptin-S1; Short=PLS-S1 [Pithecopus nordestinus]
LLGMLPVALSALSALSKL